MKRVLPNKKAYELGVISAIELESRDFKNLKKNESEIINFAQESMAIIDREGIRQVLISVRGKQKFFPVKNLADSLLNFR